jgi:aspartate-semialdehyde dehydrogenase
MMEGYNIAILGATGLVGRTILQILEEMDFPIGELRLFASDKSNGTVIDYRGKSYTVKAVEKKCFIGVRYVFFCAGAEASRTYVHQAEREGASVIDNSSAFRNFDSFPLVIPEVNLKDAISRILICSPNSITIQSVIPLYALDKHFKALEVTYNTYHSISASGIRGLEAYQGYNEIYPYDIKETCIPQVGEFLEDGYTTEEINMIQETKKILHNQDLLVSATCIRVPVEYSNGVQIRVKLEKDFTLEEVRKVLKKQKGLVVLDDITKMKYPVSTVATGTDKVYVGRIRRDKIDKNTLLMYCVADNLRKGAAINSIQIMKGLVAHAEKH